MTRAPPRFSAVVPALNERAEIEATLERARAALGPDAELIVVDGGSTDGTVDVSARLAAVRRTAANRGAQLAHGAAGASGRILVFVHADTWLAPDAGEAIGRAVDEGAVAGCLRMGFRDAEGWRYRILARAITLRTRIFRTATGDQVIFATREAYEAGGGVPEIPIFEDVELVRRLRSTGRFRVVPARAFTSARRWRSRGFGRTVARHVALRIRHALGADPHDLASTYR